MFALIISRSGYLSAMILIERCRDIMALLILFYLFIYLFIYLFFFFFLKMFLPQEVCKFLAPQL